MTAQSSKWSSGWRLWLLLALFALGFRVLSSTETAKDFLRTVVGAEPPLTEANPSQAFTYEQAVGPTPTALERQHAEATFRAMFPDIVGDAELARIADKHYEDAVRENSSLSYGAALMEAGYRTRRSTGRR